MRKVLASALAFFAFCSFEANGQLYSVGTEPGNVRWKQVRTENYRVVYPAGMDSLAREYAVSLEKFRGRVGATIGYEPNQCYKKQMPVILHPFVASSNGVVTWAPRRMELYTVPDDSSPLPISAMEHLVVHESRHVAQMQFAADKPYRGFNYVLGEFWPGIMSALYPGPTFFEGDAVVAETELTPSGRGKTSSFLKYYDICFAEGDFRDYPKWRFGSQKNYTPDHYRAGYLTIGGMRAFYNDPEFTKRYFNNVNSHFLPFFVLQKTVKETSGKTFKETFSDIAARQRDEWEKNAIDRGPFMPREKLTLPERLYTTFQENEQAGEGFFSIRSGLDRTAEIVRVYPNGHVRAICNVGSSAASFTFSDLTQKLYWSEYRRDPRWELKSSSVIRQMDMHGKVTDLTLAGHKYYSPSAEGNKIVVAEYPDEGGSAVVVLDASDGSVIRRTPAPSGMQVVEFCEIGEKLYCTAVTEGGYGIFDENFNAVLAPSRIVITNLFEKNGELFFTADRNGSEELYALNPADGSVRQFTSSRFGGDFYSFRGDSLYFLSGSRDDYGYYRTAVSDLPVRKVDFFEQDTPLIANTLTEQASAVETDDPGTPTVSVEDYGKLAHLFKFHSWMPAYFNFDEVSNLSMETLTTDAGIGATALFHNDLNTMQGFIGWSAWTPSSGWRSALHGKFEYRGWYPVVELSFDLGERNALQYFPYRSDKFAGESRTFPTRTLSAPYFKTKAKVYVPLNFSSGGWNRGVIPQAEYTMSNDVFSTGVDLKYIRTVSTSVRAYTMQPVAPSCIYPRFGIGGELGYRWHPQLTNFTVSSHYLFLYGYVPGFVRTHGIRLSATYESASDDYFTAQFTYALPFAPVDWSFLWPVAYVRNFEFKANVSATQCFTDAEKNSFIMRGELAARLGNLLWIPYDTRLGISVNWDAMLGKVWAGLVFSVDL